MALAADDALFGECKWTSRPVGTNILDDLKRKAHPLMQAAGLRTAHFALFARSGFTEALQAQARHEEVLLVGPDALVQPPRGRFAPYRGQMVWHEDPDMRTTDEWSEV